MPKRYLNTADLELLLAVERPAKPTKKIVTLPTKQASAKKVVNFRPPVVEVKRSISDEILLYKRDGSYETCAWNSDPDLMFENFQALRISSNWNFRITKVQTFYKVKGSLERAATVDLAEICAGLKSGGLYNLFMEVKNPKGRKITAPKLKAQALCRT